MRPDTEDLILFGSFAAVAIGALLVVAASAGNGFLAIGVGLIVFGVPSAIVTFLAAGEPE